MASITPDEGLEWIAERVIPTSNTADEELYSIAVGSGTTAPAAGDTQLAVEEYRGIKPYSNISFEDTSPAIGEVQCRVTVSGGTEVPAGTDITELGVFARDPSISENNVTDSDDSLIYREVRDSAVTIASGDRKTFSFTISVTNG